MFRRLCLVVITCCASLAVQAQEAGDRPRLVTGGMGRAHGAEMLNFGQTSFGTLTDGLTPNGVLTTGGYAAYAFNRSDDGQTAVRLGFEWAMGSSDFSLNPLHAGISPLMQDGSGLSLSFTHDVSPSLSLGGFAATQKTEDHLDLSNLRLGAGLGLKF